MILNGTAKIKDGAGDFIVLFDYGQDGLSVVHQDLTLAGAVEWNMACATQPSAIVKLVRIDAIEKP